MFSKRIVMCGIAASLLSAPAAPVSADIGDGIVGGLVGFVGLWAIAEGYRRWRGREGMGGGDPKLLGAIGLWLGWRMLPGVLLAACVIGLGFVTVRHLLGQRASGQDMVPLGLLLALAAYPAWLLMIGMAA